jgi:hypothetical protein
MGFFYRAAGIVCIFSMTFARFGDDASAKMLIHLAEQGLIDPTKV